MEDRLLSSISFNAIDKAQQDKNEYHHFTLPNGLSVLIVQLPYGKNPETNEPDLKNPLPPKNVGVAMSVKVGHFSDPKEFPGLAHFLEHMLFMGNTKYPGENEWEDYITTHGGYSNASTDCEHTIYQFEVTPNKLYESLDMFAHFFISPIFIPDATKREVRAVDSEFKDAYQNDNIRYADVFNETLNESHPASKFGWGNVDTLELTPEAKGLNTREALLEFHEKHYSSHAMELCVVVDSTVDNDVFRLIPFLYNLFNQIPCHSINSNVKMDYLNKKQALLSNKDRDVVNSPISSNFNITSAPCRDFVPVSDRPPLISFESYGLPIQNTCNNELFLMSPVKDDDLLTISWTFESIVAKYKSKPSDVLEFLIGHECKNGLSWILKEEGLATSLMAGCSNDESSKNTAFSLYTISVSLTKKGLSNYWRVIEICHQYILLLRQTSDDLLLQYLKELQQINEISFHYAQSMDPLEMAEYLVSFMQIYEPCDILTGITLITEVDLVTTRRILDTFTPANARYDLASKDIDLYMSTLPTYSSPLGPRDSRDSPTNSVAWVIGDLDEDQDEDEDEDDDEDEDVKDSEKTENSGKLTVSQQPNIYNRNLGDKTELRELFHKIDPNTIYDGSVVYKTPHFKVKYLRRTLSADLLDYFNNISLHPKLDLPSQNPYIPSNFDILKEKQDYSKLLAKFPDIQTLDMPLLLRGEPLPNYITSDGEVTYKSLVVGGNSYTATYRPHGVGDSNSNLDNSNPADVNTNTNTNTNTNSIFETWSKYNPTCPTLTLSSPFSIHHSLLTHSSLYQPSSSGELWYLPDHRFNLPRASYTVLFQSTKCYESPLSVVLHRLLINFLLDSLEESTYGASLCETSFELEFYKMGMEIRFTGFSHKIDKLINKVINEIHVLLEGLTSEIIDFSKKTGCDVNNIDSTLVTQHCVEFPLLNRFFDMRIKSVRSFKHHCYDPGNMSSFLRLWHMQKRRFSIYDLLDAAIGPNTGVCEGSHITPSLFVDSIKHMFGPNSIYPIVLAHGNISSSEAIAVYDDINAILSKTTKIIENMSFFNKTSVLVPLPWSLATSMASPTNPSGLTVEEVRRATHEHNVYDYSVYEESIQQETTTQVSDDSGVLTVTPSLCSNRYQEHILSIPTNTHTVIKGVVRNVKEKASTIATYYQAGVYTPFLAACNSLLVSILYEPCFDFLRTKNQLGYSCHIETTTYDNTCGISIEVTSSSHQHRDIVKIIDSFVLEYRNQLADKLNQEGIFSSYKSSIISQMSSSTNNLADVTSRLWTCLRDGSYYFEDRLKQIHCLHSLTVSDVLFLYDTVLLGIKPTTTNCISPAIINYCDPISLTLNRDDQTVNTSVSNAKSILRRVTSIALGCNDHDFIPLSSHCNEVFTSTDDGGDDGDDEDEDGDEDGDEDDDEDIQQPDNNDAIHQEDGDENEDEDEDVEEDGEDMKDDHSIDVSFSELQPQLKKQRQDEAYRIDEDIIKHLYDDVKTFDLNGVEFTLNQRMKDKLKFY